ncbi:MAG: serine hydrolase [Chloroflexaceae bacterium]|nr:serine hydrolase [Chloroflexaceae bacterium]
MFAQPLDYAPGETFVYKPTDSHLLSAIITEVSGKSTLEYGRERIFDPLGIPTDEAAGFAWNTDAQGYYGGPTGLRLRTHDLAKLGYLYVNNGVWNGAQLIPAEYVAESTRTQSEGDWSDAGDVTYGYHWWVADHGEYQAFFAAGFGGQFIYVIPDLNIVVVTVSEINESVKELRDIIDEGIIPAAE